MKSSSDRTNEMSPKRRKIRDNTKSNVTHPGGGQVPPLAQTFKIKLRNQFDNLSNHVDVPEPTGTPVKRKLPPIVVHGIFENHNETVKIMKKKVPNGTFIVQNIQTDMAPNWVPEYRYIKDPMIPSFFYLDNVK